MSEEEIRSALSSVFSAHATVAEVAAPHVVSPPEGRSPHWPAVRAAHLKEQPACACCGAVRLLNVHHIRPFHLFPELELEPSNLITLCEGGRGLNCHFLVGHCLNWEAWNSLVISDAGGVGLMLRGRKNIAWSNS